MGGKYMTQDYDIMNRELQDWIKETKQDLPKKEETEDHKLGEPTGKCDICGENAAKFICMKCEKSICPSCYFKLIGICKNCVPADIAEKWKGNQPDWEKILGVKWVD